MAKRNAAGAGSIRKKTVLRDGREYTYWEARLTVGVDPGTGKQIRRSFSGASQREVREKMQAAAVAVNDSTYQEPSKLTVSDWLDIWLAEYTADLKPLTRSTYKNKVESTIKPTLGAVKLQALKAPQIQKMLNDLHRGTSGRKPLSAKTVKDIYGILHRALGQAVEVGYLRINPSDACKLPRVERAEIKPLDEALVLQAAQETGVIVTSEEHSVIGGLGAAVAEYLSENYPVPVIRHGVEDCFGRSGTAAAVLAHYGLTPEVLCQKVKLALSKKR